MCGGHSLSLGSNLLGLPDPIQKATGNVKKKPKAKTTEAIEAELQAKLDKEKAQANALALTYKKSEADKDQDEHRRRVRTLLGMPADTSAAARWKPTAGLFGLARVPMFVGVKTAAPATPVGVPQPNQDYANYATYVQNHRGYYGNVNQN